MNSLTAKIVSKKHCSIAVILKTISLVQKPSDIFVTKHLVAAVQDLFKTPFVARVSCHSYVMPLVNAHVVFRMMNSMHKRGNIFKWPLLGNEGVFLADFGIIRNIFKKKNMFIQ